MKKKFTDLFSKGTYKSDSNEKKSTKDVATVEKVGYFELYRFATFADKVLLVIGSILTIIVGIGNPLMMTFFGDVTQAFVTYDVEMRRLNATNGNDTAKMDGDGIDAGTVFYAELVRYVIISSIFGTLTVVLTYIATVIFHYTAQKQIFKIRTSYFRSVLNQDIAWYDTHQTGDFVTRITEDLIKIQEAIGDKVSIFLYFFSVFVAGIVIALTLGWQLALVCLVPCPLSIASMAFMTCITTKFTKNEMESYGAAGAIAEEVFGAIKTVTAFEGQAKEHERYKKHLVAAERNNMKRSIFTAIATGVMWFNIYAAIALSFWYGVKLVLESRHLPEEEAIYNTSVMFAVFFATLSSNWSFGQCSPYFDKFAAAQTAAYKIFRTIDAAPNINASKAGGQTPARIAGEIAFDDVRFEYPSRPDVKILKGLSFRIKAGETVALVGASGCGKSTCIQLIQRFYDPTSGCVSLDGTDVRKLNLNWLRSHIGVVGQEPVLFATTIAENIRYGNVKVTQAEIEEAAKKANAHSFIIGLPDGYQTLVGERGAQLSGGQKQRIAIARALVKTPTILLLDEATSALDTNSESIVQAALDSASKNSTTVIVAHRLSTVRDADRILVVADGAVVEEGTHTHLMDLKNHYYNLVMRQTNEIDVVNDEEDRSAADEEIADDAQRKLSRVDRKEHDVNEESPIDDSVWSALKSVMRMNRPEWFHIALGCLSSIATGAALPIYSVIFGSVIGVLSHTDDEYVRSRTDTYCLYLLVLGLLAGVASFVQMHTFTVAGEKLTKRIRSRLFCAVLRQEQGWFDAKENGVGGLCARLSTDAAYIQGASGQPIGTLLNAASTLGLAIGFAVSFEWRTALVTLCFTPVLLISVYLEQKILTASATKHNKPFEDSSKLAVEAINGIRTVASLGCEETFIDMYHDKLEEYVRKARNDGHFEGFALGMCRGSMFVTYGISLFYGGTLVLDQTVDYSNVFKATEALVTGSWSMGTAIGYAPNFQRGLLAAKKIMRIINRVPSIRNPSYVRELVWDNGTINYKRVTFAYPTRPTTTVLHGLDLHIEQGHTVALVGASGCGKSTIVQLLQRFYDPTSGRIALDATDIKDVTLQALRANFGIVSQEPVLFDRTIAENIAYGDNNRAVTMAEIIEAAKSANIHGFVIALPQGYDTPLGEKGTQLSGGQKQRMAIARALIRNPKVLLLDEATSALDAESEKIVQEALDNAKKDRTCITIAHRLTTIKDADVICVVNRGRIEEIGSHNELLQKKGLYYNLQMLQK